MNIFLSIIPILVVFILIFVFHKSALQTGILGLIITIFISLIYFNKSMLVTYNAIIKGFLISMIAAYVVYFGILLFHLMKKSNKIEDMGEIISNCTSDKIAQLLMIVIGLSPLIESTSGFGTAFLIVTPIIVSIGISPVKSVLIGLVSLLSVPWGALATGTIIGSQLSNISSNIIGIGSAIIIFPTYLYFLLVIVYIAYGFSGILKGWKSIILFAISFGIVNLVSNIFISVELAGVISAFAILIIGVLNLILKKDFHVKKAELFKCMSPYIILTFLIFVTRLIPGVKRFLNHYLEINIPKYNFQLPLLYSPGFWLFITVVATIYIFKINKNKVWASVKETTKQWGPFLFSTTCFVAIAQLMVLSGMTKIIATTIGNTFNDYFIFISPILGGIGGFLTASNTGANAMFINLQTQIGHKTGLSPELLAYSQNVSASHATMASPSRVMLGTEMYSIQNKENKLLMNITLIVSVALIIISLILYLYSIIIKLL